MGITKTQDVVSNALALARTQGFEVGLRHLRESGYIRMNEESALSWFAEKCKEHEIPSPLFPHVPLAQPNFD